MDNSKNYFLDYPVHKDVSMFCKFCGQELDDDSEFCPKCGRKQKETITDRFEETVHDFTKQLQPKIEEASRASKFSFKWSLYKVLKKNILISPEEPAVPSTGGISFL